MRITSEIAGSDDLAVTPREGWSADRRRLRVLTRAVVWFLLTPACVLAMSGAASAALTTKPDTAVSSAQVASARPRAIIAASTSSGAVVNDPNCGANTLPANDDGSTSEVALPFTLNFFGTDYSSLWINNNGNVTFSGPLSTYTPFTIGASTPPIIAPYFADVDTRGVGSGLVTWGSTTFEGHQAFCVDWSSVGYYYEHTDKLNDFQLLLVNRSDAGAGDFDIVFNYDQIQWETGDASGGTGGLGGTSAGVGFSNGDGSPNHFFQLNGSLQNGAFLDSNPTTGLINNAYGDTVPGRYVFHVTGGSGGSSGGISGLSRPWPTSGYGYSFQNQGVTGYEIPSGMSPSQVWTGLNQTFSDWGRNGPDTSRLISQLNGEASGGLCFGLALSGGRFDSGLDALSNPLEGRGDLIWSNAQNGTIGSAGTGPSASMNLPAPGTPSNSFSFNQEFLSLISDDWASQLATQVQSSLQLQHYAYADPTTGFGAFESQLQNVMQSGTNNFDPSGMLSSPSGNGFAMITLQTLNPSVGHEVLAYSAEPLSDGSVQLDVWDNNFPGQNYAIVVHPDLSWTYNAPYNNGDFQGNYSMSGAPGHALGMLAILPLYNPSGLNFYPAASGGLGTGSLVDLAPGTTLSNATDNANDPVDVEPVLSDAGVGDSGEIIDFPSDAGQVTLSGSDPSLDVRGANTYMTLGSTAAANGLNVSEDEQNGAISAASNAVSLTVGRSNQVVMSNGAGGLTYRADGTISTANDSSNTSVQVEFLRDGQLKTATLFSGATPTGGGLSFTPAEVSAAEAAATASSGGGATQSAGGGGGTPSSGSAKALQIGRPSVSGKAMRVSVTCAGAGGATCSAKLALSVVETLKGHRLIAIAARAGVTGGKHKKPKVNRKTVLLGIATVTLGAGQTRTVVINLNPAGQHLLTQLHKLNVKLSVTEDGKTFGDGSITFKLAPGNRPKEHHRR